MTDTIQITEHSCPPSSQEPGKQGEFPLYRHTTRLRKVKEFSQDHEADNGGNRDNYSGEEGFKVHGFTTGGSSLKVHRPAAPGSLECLLEMQTLEPSLKP